MILGTAIGSSESAEATRGIFTDVAFSSACHIERQLLFPLCTESHDLSLLRQVCSQRARGAPGEVRRTVEQDEVTN